MKYFLKSKGTAVIVARYDEDSKLTHIEFEKCDDRQLDYVKRNLPIDESGLVNFCSKAQLQLFPEEVDVSFDNFWNVFSYKVGKKPRAKRLWDLMTKNEKIAALIVIPKYHRFIGIMNQNSAYPETWLHSRMWENEYVVK